MDVELKVVDRTSIVAALDYSVNSSKGWQAVLPSDNIFDCPEEGVSFSVPGLPAGSHQITVRATDAKGNQAFESVLVTVDATAATANDQRVETASYVRDSCRGFEPCITPTRSAK